MKRREFITLLGGAVAASILCTQPPSAQQTRPVIGIRRCSRYIKGVGAKKQRREPSRRLQRQNAPSVLGCVSENGTSSVPNKR